MLWIVVGVVIIATYVTLFVQQELEWRKTRSYFMRDRELGWRPGVPAYDEYKIWARVVRRNQRRRMRVNLVVTTGTLLLFLYGLIRL